MRRARRLVSMTRRRAIGLLAIAAGAAMAGEAVARDGFVEISQSCATATGCFPGDAAGFPVTIDGSAGRSYRLSSDLKLPNVNTNGIVLAADGLELDLAGFAILGPVACSGSPTVCTPTGGTGVGIAAASPAVRSGSIHDGAVSGQGDAGIRLGEGISLRALRVRSNGGVGIEVAAGSIVQDVVVATNGDDGIRADRSRIADSLVAQNGGDGIRSSFGNIEACHVVRNGGAGLVVSEAVVVGNSIEGNALDGIQDAGGSSILRNSVNRNLQDGIETIAGASLIGNVARENGGFGIRLAAGSSFRANTIASGTAQTVDVAGGLDLGANACNGVPTCP